jgi:hypothetical protein
LKSIFQNEKNFQNRNFQHQQRFMTCFGTLKTILVVSVDVFWSQKLRLENEWTENWWRERTGSGKILGWRTEKIQFNDIGWKN